MPFEPVKSHRGVIPCSRLADMVRCRCNDMFSQRPSVLPILIGKARPSSAESGSSMSLRRGAGRGLSR